MVLLALKNILICLVSSIPGYFLSEYLIGVGLVRRIESNLEYIIDNIILGILGTLFFSQAPWWLFVIATFLLTTFGQHKFELRHTLGCGRWWWLANKQD
jgi:hypothetical protein